ncbi:MAG: hypothetical protein QM790_12085 [Nibricoccus sp.]
MIIPRFWAEGRVQHRTKERQVTVRRFGWSDVSQEDAQGIANRRAEEALKRVLSGNQLPRREPKVPYNGAEGVPIREEIVDRFGSSVVTRNIYGALCLNTPDVLFADIDFQRGPTGQQTCGTLLLMFIVGIMVGVYRHSLPLGLGTIAVGLLLGLAIPRIAYRVRLLLKGGEEKQAMGRVERFLKSHSNWRVRVYWTPAGLRLLAIHRRFSPTDPEVEAFFKACGTDRIYVRMCKNQQCFRARLTPKPWRVGISDHLKPRPGVWPINPERMPERRAWVEKYEKASAAYSACHYVTTLGFGGVDSYAESVQKFHDEHSRALSSLPIA